MRIGIAAVGLFSCPILVGCSSFVTGLATQSGAAAGVAAGRTAPPAAIDKLTEMDTPAYQEQIARIVRSATAQDASRVLGNGIGRGIVDEVVAIANDFSTTQTSDPGFRNDPTTRPSLRLPSVEVEQLMKEEIDPIIGENARTFVNQGIKAGTGTQAQDGARAITRTIGDGAMRGALDALKDHGPVLRQVIVEQLGPAVGEALRQQITPWVQELRKQNFRGDIRAVLQEEVAPAARQLWDQGAKDTLLIPTQSDMAPLVVTNSRNLSKGAGFGTHDAMVELGVLDASGNFTPHLKLALWGIVALGVLIGIATTASVVALIIQIVRMLKSSWQAPIIKSDPATRTDR